MSLNIRPCTEVAEQCLHRKEGTQVNNGKKMVRMISFSSELNNLIDGIYQGS